MTKQYYGEGAQQEEWKLGWVGFLGICAAAIAMYGCWFYGAMLGTM